jgi:hypothetical protein
MHLAVSSTGIALPRPRVGGQGVLIAVIAGVAWLAMMGAYVSSYVLGHPVELIPKTYETYGLTDVAPTSYGSISIASADLSTDDGITTAAVSVQLDNIRSRGVEAPQVEELKLVDGTGKQVSRPAAVAWNGPAFVAAEATARIDITLEAPADAGPLWLQYQNVRGSEPIRFALTSGASR